MWQGGAVTHKYSVVLSTVTHDSFVPQVLGGVPTACRIVSTVRIGIKVI